LKRKLPSEAQSAPRKFRRLPAAQLLIATANALPPASQGKLYTHAFTLSGGKGPYQWSVIGGRLPAGLTLSPAGVLSGIPNASGKFSFTVRVTDSTRLTTTKIFALAVGAQAGTLAAPGKSITTTPRPVTGLKPPKTIAVVTPLSATGFATAPIVPKTITVGTPLSATGF
jgi:hypothetical protein